MKKLLALTLIVLGIGANVLACGCSARNKARAPKPPTTQK